MSGKMYETFDRAYLREAEKARDAAEEREDYTLRCQFGEKVFFHAGNLAVIPGHIYSRRGKDEFDISKCCEYHFDKMFKNEEAMGQSLDAVTGGIERVMYTGVVWEHYQGSPEEKRYATTNIADADVISSEVYGEPDTHVVALDIDVPARLIPSSTPGHHHLHIDVKCSWEDYADFLRAAEKIGIIEPGYLGASLQRKGTHLRMPWIKKELPLDEIAQTMTDDQREIEREATDPWGDDWSEIQP